MYGDNVAYSLVDHIYDRQLFTQVSMTGQSRTGQTKECFQKFERALNFFFNLTNKFDPNYTLKSTKDFFQKLISHSKRRCIMPRIRSSRVKLRNPIKKKKRSTTAVENFAAATVNSSDASNMMDESYFEEIDVDHIKLEVILYN